MPVMTMKTLKAMKAKKTMKAMKAKKGEDLPYDQVWLPVPDGQVPTDGGLKEIVQEVTAKTNITHPNPCLSCRLNTC